MKQIILDGTSLTFEKIVSCVFEKTPVTVSEEARIRVRKARELVFDLEHREVPVYGLNTGVGLNKDRKVEDDFMEQFNKNVLRSHCIAIGKECSEEEVRAILLVRLNGFLCGRSGVSEEIVDGFVFFLNHEVYPVIRRKGSVGETDIGALAAVGMCMVGEGEAFVKGKRLQGMEVLEEAGMKPVCLGPKDCLGMISSNAQSCGMAAVLVMETEKMFHLCQMIYCLFLEGYEGVAAPLDRTVNQIRGYRGQIACADYARKCLKDSYIWKISRPKALQDPLSIRDQCAVLGAAVDALDYLKVQLIHEINCSDDNPCLIPEEGRVSGSANFEPLSWILPVEMLITAFGHISNMISHRILRISNPDFSGLTRFLTPDQEKTIAFSTVQKLSSSLNTQIRTLARTSSLDFEESAGGIEDHATNAVYTVEKAFEALDYLYYLMSMELMHASQAVDLRKVQNKLGEFTEKLYQAYRREVPFLDRDRNLSIDIEKGYAFLKKYTTDIKI